jgi:hypothetical protein
MGARRRLATVKCKSADEAANLQRALDQPEIVAFLNIVGALLPLGDSNRTRVLEFVNDIINVEAGRIRVESQGHLHKLEAKTARG